ncbi:MAG TPA: aldo/keto reductase [bacterium]|jgi:predicted aldo/keto reductase-like oxidoreductase|nr:aldo/keto reductase [Dictyoglomota bacterium]HOK29791.1 aldo/keto reductase [bacterium]HON71879.1 aldo/keto reductase [bacterium]HOP55836.1 aldo/keto reductase [bacterium]HRR91411.1 aldo/keto reductase [bacterium]
MDKRPYGKTGEMLSIIGFGGIVAAELPQEEANSIVALAIDRGVNYFDVAPTYMDAEERLGIALKGKRNNIFLACKTGKRTKEEARKELENSLRLLNTDHFDLYQLHSMTTDEDFEVAMGPGGAMETFVKAKDEGLIRYIGFSAHSVEVALKLLDAFQFDSVLFPLNWVNYFNANFGPQVVEKAMAKGVARLALKAMAKTVIPEGQSRKYEKCWYLPVDEPELASLALRFTLSQPITAAIPPGEPKLFKMALDIAEKFTPITEEEIRLLKEKAKGLEPIFRLRS